MCMFCISYGYEGVLWCWYDGGCKFFFGCRWFYLGRSIL